MLATCDRTPVVLALLIVGLPLASAVPAAGAATGPALWDNPDDWPKPGREPHDPIHIRNDGDLVLPDEVSGNGVRGGTGTPQDPYVIENWTISSDEETAIRIENVRLHLVIRDVRLTQDAGPSRSGSEEDVRSAISVYDSENLTIASVNVTGKQAEGIRVQESSVIIRGSRFSNNWMDGFDRRRGVGILYRGADLTVQENRFDGVPFFIEGAPDPLIQLSRVRFLDNEIVPQDDLADAGLFSGDVVKISGNDGAVPYIVRARSSVESVHITDNAVGELKVDVDQAGDADATVRIESNRFTGDDACPPTGTWRTGLGRYCRALIVETRKDVYSVRFEVSENTFRDYPGRVVNLERSPFVIERNAFFQSSDCAWMISVEADSGAREAWGSQGSGYQAINENDFVRAPKFACGVALAYRGEGRPLDAENNYWGSKPPQKVPADASRTQLRAEGFSGWYLDGDVDFEPWSDDAHVVSSEEIERYLEGEDRGPPLSGLGSIEAITGWLMGVGVSILYGRRKRS